MTAYLLKRLSIALLTLVLASMVVFAVLEVLPGDPARLMLGLNASADRSSCCATRWASTRRLPNAICTGPAAC